MISISIQVCIKKDLFTILDYHHFFPFFGKLAKSFEWTRTKVVLLICIELHLVSTTLHAYLQSLFLRWRATALLSLSKADLAFRYFIGLGWHKSSSSRMERTQSRSRYLSAPTYPDPKVKHTECPIAPR